MESKLIEELRAVLDRYSVHEPKVGEWIVVSKPHESSTTYQDALILYAGKDKNHFGFNYVGKLIEDFGNVWQEENRAFRKATDEEVLSAFTNYFRGKGFKEGSRFKSVYNGSLYIYKEPLSFEGKDIFSNNIGCLFKTIIQPFYK